MSADGRTFAALAQPRMDGKRVVITGATSGIGRATALALGKLGANLILISRNRPAGDALVRRIGHDTSGARAEFIETDLSAPAQVRFAANHICTRWDTVDVLINNAGARFDTFASTPEGFERTFATNHLGHFVLTNRLLERLTAAPEARIITVSSSAATQAVHDGRWQYGPTDYDRRQAYAKSKLANLFFAFELARRIAGSKASSLAVDPGTVATHFARNNGLLPWLKHLFYHGRRGELVRASTGADTLIHLASASTLPAGTSGKYFHRRRQIIPCPAALDRSAAATLWTLSEHLTGTVFPSKFTE